MEETVTCSDRHKHAKVVETVNWLAQGSELEDALADAPFHVKVVLTANRFYRSCAAGGRDRGLELSVMRK